MIITLSNWYNHIQQQIESPLIGSEMATLYASAATENDHRMPLTDTASNYDDAKGRSQNHFPPGFVSHKNVM